MLASCLREQEKEVVDIMVMLFDQEYAVKQFGIAQRQEGLQDGRREGLQEGMEKGLLKGMINLVKRGLLSAKDGAEQAGISLEEFEALLAQT